MSRLTKRLGDQVILKDVGITDCGKICDRRKDFDNPCDECPIDDAFRKLAHYEDAEEAGRLIEVVRCKDCAVWRSREDGLINCPYCLDLKKDDDFCSYGVVEGDKE